MSTGYFCDKCGKAYPYENATTIMAHRHDGGTRRLGGELRLISADLCPICMLKLDDWINLKGEEEPKILALLEKTYADFCSCEGGEGWLKIDGKEYATDTGYAIEGVNIFMEVFKRRLAELPSVTPQEPFINKPCISSEVCEHDKQMVLDKIRAEIDGIEIDGQFDEHTMFIRTGSQVKQMALNILDKYKADRSEEDGNDD